MWIETFSHRARAGIKPLVDHLGAVKYLRQIYVETLMLGERAKFSMVGWPPVSSTILLTGSGRSGTTWLADVLCTFSGTQQIFEPLHPRYNPDISRITGWEWDEKKTHHEHKILYLPPEPEMPEWTSLLEKALTGRSRNYFTDSSRTSFFPMRFLVKDIWTNLMLGYIAKRFDPKIIYILRHPCAVVHSRLGVNWAANVEDILSQPQLVSDYLTDVEEDIRCEKDIIGAHAVWWAVENLVALRQLQHVPHFLVYYEDLFLHPQETLESIVAWLGLDNLPPAINRVFDKPSRTSHLTQSGHGHINHLAAWKDDLAKADQHRILNWANRLGLSMYNSDILPNTLALAGPNDFVKIKVADK
jgi:hypothetical protein